MKSKPILILSALLFWFDCLGGEFIKYEPKEKPRQIQYENGIKAYEQNLLYFYYDNGERESEERDSETPRQTVLPLLDRLGLIFAQISAFDRFYRYPLYFPDVIAVDRIWSYPNGDIAILQAISETEQSPLEIGKLSLLFLPRNRMVHLQRSDEAGEMIFSEENREFYLNPKNGRLSKYKKYGVWRNSERKILGSFKTFQQECLLDAWGTLSSTDLDLISELVALLKAHKSNVPPLLQMITDQNEYPVEGLNMNPQAQNGAPRNKEKKSRHRPSCVIC